MVGTENLSVGQHVVQFYGHDGELAERVSDYLRGALDGGGVAIVIASPEHRSEFETRLEQAGADLAAAREDGGYLALDAGETLRELMADGPAVDGAAFDRVIGRLISSAAAAGRSVLAYGEMVALLWDDGLVNAAVQLEALWNELGRRHSFSLFCGYRADSMSRDIGAFAEVCRLHQAIVGPVAAAPAAVPATVRTFVFSREAPATARHFTVATLREWGLADVADDAALVVTELAANAIVHAGSAFTVNLSARGNVLRIAVRDGCPLPAEGQAALMPIPLHGLGAVDALAGRWGVESLGKAGKTVWVDLRR
ncbi:MAG TPA: MEDS domain-containing protein [Streptosporangiaceae bacterium]|nr:MEDS domain-containing protein [Streptosporangiaceae bacterium]